jgi:hypothetical protein
MCIEEKRRRDQRFSEIADMPFRRREMCRRRRPHDGYDDLTVEDVLAEPIVRDLMRADRVDPAAFEALLRSAARPPGCTA